MFLFPLKHIPLCFVIVLLINSSFAQTSSIATPIDMGAFTNIPIAHVISDSGGLVYFSTNHGIWRYDGTEVKPLNINNTGLPQNTVPDLMFSNGRCLFFSVGMDSSTLYCYDTKNDKLHKYTFNDAVRGHTLEKDGRLLMVTKKGIILRYDNELLLQKICNLKNLKGSLDKMEMEDIHADQQGNIYVFTRTGAAKVDNKLTWFRQNSYSIYGDTSYVLSYVRRVVSSSKYLVVNYSSGFVLYDKRTFCKICEYHGNDFEFSSSVNDNIQIFLSKSSKKTIKSSPYFIINRVQNIHPKLHKSISWRNHTYLTATYNGIWNIKNEEEENKGILNWENKAIDFFKNKSVRSIYRVGNKLYVGTYQGFFVFDGNKGRKLTDLIVYTMAPLSQDKLLLGIEGLTGLLPLDTQKDSIGNSLFNARAYITKIIKDQRSFIIGDHSKLLRLSIPNRSNPTYKILLFDDRMGKIRDILMIGGYWWIASDNGLFRWNGLKLSKIYPKDGSSNTVYSLLAEKNMLLLGTANSGIVKMDFNGKMLGNIGFLDGVVGQYVYSLVKKNNLLYVGTDRGISVLDFLTHLSPVVFPDNVSLDSTYLQEFNHSAVYWDENTQHLIMGGTAGLTFINPAYFESLVHVKNAPILLSYIKTGNTGGKPEKINLFVCDEKKIVIPPEEKYVGLKFANGIGNSDILFRIKEIDSNWTKKSLKDEIVLYSLPYGQYTLQVRYPWQTSNHEWLTKTIVIEPFFYQTLLFKLLIGILAMGIAYLIWYSKLRKVKQIQQLRTTIASDLHDEIGSALTRISMGSEMLLMNQEMDKSLLTVLSRESKSALSSISDIIWSIDARNDTVDDLIFRMREYVQNMFDKAGLVQFEVNGMSEVKNVPQVIRQNTYLIFKESINNILRHNGYVFTWINITNGKDGFRLEVKNEIKALKKAQHVGQGLKNIKMRVERIKGKVEFVHEKDFFILLIYMQEWK